MFRKQQFYFRENSNSGGFREGKGSLMLEGSLKGWDKEGIATQHPIIGVLRQLKW
jgi:hypothetical protein